MSPASLVLNPGASATAVVTMTIPADALPGTLDVATLTASAGLARASGKDSLLVETGKTLAIPPLEMGQMVNGQRVYNLKARTATTQFRPGVNTATSGYNTNTYLGPTLVMTKTERVLMQVTNNLTEVTTVHWHGLHLPRETDGGPHQEIDIGETWKPSFSIINEAATAWYHPHPHGHHGSMAETATQVYRGLAGMLVVRDAHSEVLRVPKTYGVDDFPVVVQDRFVAYDAELGDALVPEYIADDFDRSNFILFSIDVTAPTANAVTSLPSTLNNITRYDASNAVTTRSLRLTLPPAINNAVFDMEVINITSTLDTQEIWSIINLIHDSPFQIVKHLDITGKEIPIPAYELGWKER